MRIFISYAREDLEAARELFLKLKAAGYEPWMDKPPAPYQNEGILPGQRWRPVIEAKIRSADLMILMLSNVSVSKQGFVQQEFRLSLHMMGEMPPDKVFAVPVLLEPCEPPALTAGTVTLSELQWTMIYEIGLDEFVASIAYLNKPS